MKRCRSCNYENVATSIHCERCGFLLDSNSIEYTIAPQSIYSTVGEEIPPPPPPITPAGYGSGVNNSYYSPPGAGEYRPDGPASYYVPSEYQSDRPAQQHYAPGSYLPPTVAASSRKRTVGGSVLSSILYIWGMLWALMGFFGTFSAGLNEGMVGLIIFGGLLFGLVVLFLLLILYKQARLKSGWRVVWTLTATVLEFFALLISESLLMAQHHPDKVEQAMQNYYLGIPLCVYGLVVTVIAFI
ncbi:hypothetical protein KDA_24110 [Dictyobacter alpinus]|uniref:Uncharacterized protein n=1 Tax=Dictyobacter alpinus TaxID=2014873 RepID=A0A402B6I1_9CHLR|nr:hypothetical protein [Dictyobacter alpinus]GCE26927.1 hypothetical protein KDA_24110 [Dictyobacter alpinus]